MKIYMTSGDADVVITKAGDNDSVDVSWHVNNDDNDSDYDNDSDEIDDRWRERMEYF